MAIRNHDKLTLTIDTAGMTLLKNLKLTSKLPKTKDVKKEKGNTILTYKVTHNQALWLVEWDKSNIYGVRLDVEINPTSAKTTQLVEMSDEFLEIYAVVLLDAEQNKGIRKNVWSKQLWFTNMFYGELDKWRYYLVISAFKFVKVPAQIQWDILMKLAQIKGSIEVKEIERIWNAINKSERKIYSKENHN